MVDSFLTTFGATVDSRNPTPTRAPYMLVVPLGH